MAWSYRQDGLDEIYHDKSGPALVSGQVLPETPASADHADELLNPPKVDQGPAKRPEKPKVDVEKMRLANEERNRIRMEEQQKLRDEEIAKERDKIRKEETEKAPMVGAQPGPKL